MKGKNGFRGLTLIVMAATFAIGCNDDHFSTVVYTQSPAGNTWGDLYLMNYSGGDRSRVTDSGADAYPRWSPDKEKIAFNRRIGGPAGHWDIYLINPDGTGEVELVGGDADDVNPAWSPDGSKLAYQSNRSGTNEIWIMNVETGLEWVLPIAGDVFPTHPTWSPAGDKIAFRGVGGPGIGGLTGIWVVNYPAGDGLTLLAEDGNEPDWSHASRRGEDKIVYRLAGDIKVMNGDGTDQRIVTQGAYPTWSVKFDEIVFQRYRSSATEHDFDVYRVQADGTLLFQMTDDADVDQRYPHW